MLRNKQFYAPTQEVEGRFFVLWLAETITAGGIEKLLKFKQFG